MKERNGDSRIGKSATDGVRIDVDACCAIARDLQCLASEVATPAAFVGTPESSGAAERASR
jgi:hypothetical protein